MELILKYTLKKIQEQTSLIPDLNAGGCCHFAKLLAKELEVRGIPFSVILYHDYPVKDKIKDINKRKAIIAGNNHVALKIDDLVVDGIKSSKTLKGLYTSITKCKTTMKYSDLRYYSGHGIWNPLFNKKKYHPVLSKVIKNQFKVYDKLKNNE